MTERGGDRRQRLAAQRAAQQQAQVRKRRLWLAGGSIVAVIAVVVAFVLASSNGNSSGSSSGNTAAPPTGSALTSVLGQLTSVPAGTLDQVGAGTTSSNPTTITGPALTSAGKPEMLYIGAEYCPYCAAERWAMIVALSRFGTFSGLAPIRSAAKDGGGNAEPFPLTPTWTFAKATYTSPYLTFTPVEGYTNIPDTATGFYTVLQPPTAAQQALLDKYDAANQGAIPFIDYGNRFMSVGASYNPAILSGLTWAQIADDLHDPSSAVGKSVLGTANFATAAICSLTDNKPASACTSTVRALQAKI
jgi:thiol-disulfide isomerase/thioredoxin